MFQCEAQGGAVVKVLEILVKARELIATPERWTQGAYGRFLGDTFTAERVVTAEHVESFCLIGACLRASGDADLVLDDSRLSALGLGSYGQVLIFNDEHTHAEVLARLDAAISKLQAEAVPSC